jgi:hypothetical protein
MSTTDSFIIPDSVGKFKIDKQMFKDDPSMFTLSVQVHQNNQLYEIKERITAHNAQLAALKQEYASSNEQKRFQLNVQILAMIQDHQVQLQAYQAEQTELSLLKIQAHQAHQAQIQAKLQRKRFWFF